MLHILANSTFRRLFGAQVVMLVTALAIKMRWPAPLPNICRGGGMLVTLDLVRAGVALNRVMNIRAMWPVGWADW